MENKLHDTQCRQKVFSCLLTFIEKLNQRSLEKGAWNKIQ